MAFPFFDRIKGTTSGTPGTGAFTPNAASTGFNAWSTVPAGWIGLVLYEDGATEELRYGYWNGTTISRPTAGFHSSSSGSGLTLTSAATAALIVAADAVAPHLGRSPTAGWLPTINATSHDPVGVPAIAAAGTGTAAPLANTNALTRQPRIQYASATTANAQCGFSVASAIAQAVYSSTAGVGGFELSWRFGASQLPTGPRLFMGMNDGGASFVGNTANPSAFAGYFAIFGKDSGDTNIQFMTNDAGGTAGKTDTGIPLAANGWYQAVIWSPPGGGRVYGLLIRIDTGDIWYGSTTTDLPVTGTLMMPEMLGGLSATTGTAFKIEIGAVIIRSGG